MAKSSGILYNALSEGYWDITGVFHRGETRTYRFFEQMTPEMTQKEAIKEYGELIPSASLVWEIVDRVYDLRGENPKMSEQFRASLQNNLRRWPLTSSLAGYNPEGEVDEVIHNYQTTHAEYSLRGNLVGIDGWIKDIPDKLALKLLLETGDVDKINKVFQWINGTDTRIWRENSKPSQRIERVVGFSAGGYGLLLDADRGPALGHPAFRVLRSE